MEAKADFHDGRIGYYQFYLCKFLMSFKRRRKICLTDILLNSSTENKLPCEDLLMKSLFDSKNN